MLNTLETGTLQVHSVAERRQQLPRDALTQFSTAKVRDGAPDASYRPPLAAQSQAGKLKSTMLKQMLASDRSLTERAADPAPAPAPAPESQAQSIVAAQVGDFLAKWFESGGLSRRSSFELPTAGVSDAAEEVFEYPTLDAAWKIIPTASFDADTQRGSVELLV